MEKILGTRLTRDSLGHILGLSTLFAVMGAFLLDRVGVRSHGIGPIAFVLASMAVLTLLFVVWPILSHALSRSYGGVFQSVASSGLRKVFGGTPIGKLWESRPRKRAYSQIASKRGDLFSQSGSDRRRQNVRSENDPRLNAAVFAANVPTFVLDADQRMIDWNPAFHLVFRKSPGLRRGSHISQWFKTLENFKRIPKRSSELYGEAILPMADRERVSYDSAEWGRMVFVKIMTPILDRKCGRIIGWTVVLNINSVGRRVEFFEALYSKITKDTQRRFYAACYDSIFAHDTTRRDLISAHSSNLGSAQHVLDVGAFTGELTCRLAREGRSVTCVEGDIHLLRRIVDKTAGFGSKVKIVMQNPRSLQKLPTNRFDGVTLLLTVNRWADPVENLMTIRSAMRKGGTLTMSAVLLPYSVETLLNAIRQEMSETGRFEALKDQFNHVLEFERQEAHSVPFRYRSLSELKKAAQDSGFTIEKEFLFRTGPDHQEALALLVLKN